mgnify:CR=1 FL=1
MRVLVVEDEVRLADALVQILAKNKITADAVYDGADGLDNALTGIYDVIVLDIMLPKMDGIEVLRNIRRKNISSSVLLLTAKDDISDKVKGLDSGADDYLTKPFSVMELISRVKALLRRSMKGLKERVITIGEISLDVERRKVTVAGERCELTYKEYELLKLLMNNAGIVTPREEILSKVWETDFEGESRTIDMHIKTLRQKLGSSANRIKTVRNVGYLFETSPI